MNKKQRDKVLIESLAEYRRKRGLRQIDVCKKLHKDVGWLQRVEAGRRHLDVRELIDLARVLRFKPETLVTRLSSDR